MPTVLVASGKYATSPGKRAASQTAAIWYLSRAVITWMSASGTRRANVCARMARRRVTVERLRDERGQMLPLVVLAIIALVAAGMVVFGLGFATSLKSQGQTGADAAALGGMQELNDEWNTPHYLNGALLPPTYDPTTVRNQAASYAAQNGVTLEAISFPAGSFGEPDVEVTVSTDQKLPNGTIRAGQGSTAQARASTDPMSQNSPTITPATTTPICVDDAGSGTVGTVFQPHGGRFGFFPEPKANFAQGCESRLAGQIDALALALGLHIVGVAGSESTHGASDAVTRAHECGAAATVNGLRKSVSDQKLGQFKLTRPFTDQPNELELVGKGCTTSSDPTTTTPAPVNFGNGDVHLVPLTGGPQATLFASGGGPLTFNQSQIQVACEIYAVWKKFNLDPKELLVALDTAYTESNMGLNTYSAGPPPAYGVFQQEPAMGWGSEAAVYNVSTAAEGFFFGAGGNRGLNYYFAGPDGNMPVWYLAQDVQASGAGKSTHGAGNYGPNVPAAQSYFDRVTNGGCPKDTGA